MSNNFPSHFIVKNKMSMLLKRFSRILRGCSKKWEKKSPRCIIPERKKFSSHLAERIPEMWMNENIYKPAHQEMILSDTVWGSYMQSTNLRCWPINLIISLKNWKNIMSRQKLLSRKDLMRNCVKKKKKKAKCIIKVNTILPCQGR